MPGVEGWFVILRHQYYEDVHGDQRMIFLEEDLWQLVIAMSFEYPNSHPKEYIGG